MALDIKKFLKGIKILNETDTSKSIELAVDSGSTTGTNTVVKSVQTANRTLTLPDATDTLVGKATTDILTNKSIDADTNTLSNIENADIKAGAAIDATKLADGSVTNTELQYINTVTSNVQDQLDSKASTSDLNTHISDTTTHGTTGDIVGTTDTQALTNKTIDADLNTLSNIENADIKAGAAIDATKLADGSVTNTELQYINSLTSNAQDQLDALVTAGGTYATKALDNLASTAVNVNLLPGTDDTILLGNLTHRYASLWSKLLVNSGNITIQAGSGGSAKIILDGETINVKSSATDPVSGVAGDVYYNDTLNVLKYYNGTSWKEIGSGSGGGAKNYLTTYLNNPGNGDFETNTTDGWSLANTAMINDFPNGAPNAGASGINVFETVSNSNTLAGNYSLSVGYNTVNPGQGVISDPFVIDKEDRATVLKYSFTYNPSLSIDQSDKWGVAIYDVDNAVWIQPTNETPIITVFPQHGLAEGTFQTSYNGTTYRLFLYAKTIGGSMACVFDSFFIGPMTNISNIVRIGMKASLATGTLGASDNDVIYSVIEDDTNGSYNSSTGIYTIPESGTYSVRGGFIASGTYAIGNTLAARIHVNGSAVSDSFLRSSNLGAVTQVIYDEAILNLNAGDEVKIVSYSEATTPTYSGSSIYDVFEIFKIVSNSDGAGKVAYQPKVLALLSTNQTVNTGGGPQKVLFNTVESDFSNDGSNFITASNRYAPKEPGNYLINAAIFITGSDNRYGIYLYKNGGLLASGASGGVTGDMGADVSFSVDMNGSTDYLEVFVENFSSINTTLIASQPDTYFQAIRVSNIENNLDNNVNVSAIYNRTTSIGLLTGTVAGLGFPNKEKDTHNAYNTSTGIFTVPIAGEYEIEAMVYFDTNVSGKRELLAVRNGDYTSFNSKNLDFRFGNATYPTITIGSTKIQCVAGDTLEIQVFQDSGTTLSLASSLESRYNWVSIKRVGN